MTQHRGCGLIAQALKGTVTPVLHAHALVHLGRTASWDVLSSKCCICERCTWKRDTMSKCFFMSVPSTWLMMEARSGTNCVAISFCTGQCNPAVTRLQTDDAAMLTERQEPVCVLDRSACR